MRASDLTDEHLRAAYARRVRDPGGRRWPVTFEACIGHPMYRRLLVIYAAHQLQRLVENRGQARQLFETPDPGQSLDPPEKNAQRVDFGAPRRFLSGKDRAAGERDDD